MGQTQNCWKIHGDFYLSLTTVLYKDLSLQLSQSHRDAEHNTASKFKPRIFWETS